jgi:hypothetical protein
LGRQLDGLDKEGIPGRLLYYKLVADYSFNRYLQQFSSVYLFGNGLDLTNQGVFGSGPLFLISLPLIILGLIYLVRLPNISSQKKFIIAWITLGMIPSGLTFEPFSPHRSIMVFTMLNIISAVGFYKILIWINLRQKVIKLPLYLLSTLSVLLSILYFYHIYTVNFPVEKSEYLHYPFKQIALYAWSEYGNYDQIVFDPKFGEVAPRIGTAAHYYFAYYGKYPPSKFQQEYRVGDKPREVLFDKFSIRAVNWGEDHELKNSLIIASDWSLSIGDIDKNKIVKTFNYLDGKVAFYAISTK